MEQYGTQEGEIKTMAKQDIQAKTQSEIIGDIERLTDELSEEVIGSNDKYIIYYFNVKEQKAGEEVKVTISFRTVNYTEDEPMTEAKQIAKQGMLHLAKAVMIVLTESDKPMNLLEVAEACGVPTGANAAATTGVLEMLWHFKAVQLEWDSEGIAQYTAIKTIAEVTKEFIDA